MKVVETYIVKNLGKYRLVYMTKDGEFFISSNGAFNQRDTYLEQIPKEDALNLIDQFSPRIC